jgi:hypothetical protein
MKVLLWFEPCRNQLLQRIGYLSHFAHHGEHDKDSLAERKAAMLPHLDERQRRLFAAAEAKAVGHGGIAAVARVASTNETPRWYA